MVYIEIDLSRNGQKFGWKVVNMNEVSLMLINEWPLVAISNQIGISVRELERLINHFHKVNGQNGSK